MVLHQFTPPEEAASPTESGVRKRVCKACDRCRLKKSKCDGSNPCSRCKADNAICIFGERKKSHDKVYPKGYVEMLENQQAQLVTGLQELYRRSQSGQGWPGAPLRDSSGGAPLTHDILERLGALKQDGHTSNEAFEEDLNLMQQKLIASGAGYALQRDAMSDSSSEIDQSPIFDQAPSKSPIFTDPFARIQYPPTPPSHSPYPRVARTVSPLKTQSFSNPSITSATQWATTNAAFDDNMDFISKFDPSVDFTTIPPIVFQEQMSINAMNPSMVMKDWGNEEYFQHYCNPTLI